MRFKNASVIRKISVRNADSVRNDPEVRMFIEDAQKSREERGDLFSACREYPGKTVFSPKEEAGSSAISALRILKIFWSERAIWTTGTSGTS